MSGPGKFPRVESNYGSSKYQVKNNVNFLPITSRKLQLICRTLQISTDNPQSSNHFHLMSKEKKSRKINDTPVLLRFTSKQLDTIWSKVRYNIQIDDNGYPNQEDLHCWIYQGSTQAGYPILSTTHDGPKVPIHILALYKGTGQVPYRSRRETASHLCHNKLCIKPSHLTVESIGANGKRNNCLAYRFCKVSKRCINACGHTPRCLLPYDKSQYPYRE